MVNCSPFGPKPQFELADGTPAVGNQLFFYVAGSVGTKQDTYTNSTGGVANANPIVLNALGEPSTEIWFTAGQAYKVVYAPANDTDPPTSPIWTIDNLRGINDTSVTIDQWVASGIVPTYVSATQFTLPGDQTSAFAVGRRLKLTVTAGTVYGRITVSAFAALTTVTVVLDGSGALDSGLSTVEYGLLTPDNMSWPPTLVQAGSGISIAFDSSGRPVLSTATGVVPRLLQNVGLAVTMSASACTIALKDSGGSDPSSSSAAVIGFRSATLASGASSTVSTTAALSTVISSGSTGGTVSAAPSRIWVGAILVSGAVELAWFNSGTTGFVGTPIDEGSLISTTAEGGAGAADSAGVWYSTTARSNVPVTVLGYFDSTQTTAGTWAQSVTGIVVNPRNIPTSTITLVAESAWTSGTALNFTGIPSGAKRITVSFRQSSTNGTSPYIIQIGPVGGVETTNYFGGCNTATNSTGFNVNNTGSAGQLYSGAVILTLENSATNTWSETGVIVGDGGSIAQPSGGVKSLAGVLSALRVTTIGGADTGDNGAISLAIEF